MPAVAAFMVVMVNLVLQQMSLVEAIEQSALEEDMLGTTSARRDLPPALHADW
jgi:hypothetical protein